MAYREAVNGRIAFLVCSVKELAVGWSSITSGTRSTHPGGAHQMHNVRGGTNSVNTDQVEHIPGYRVIKAEGVESHLFEVVILPELKQLVAEV